MNFIDSIRTCYSQYVNFNGVASRSEYWYFAIFPFLTINLAYLGIYLGGRFGPSLIGLITQTLVIAIYLSTLIPTVAVTSRRLHDIGLSGWVQLIIIIPVVGGLLLLALMCKAHKDSEYSGHVYALTSSRRKRYTSAVLIALLSIFGSAVALNGLGVYGDYQIAKEIEKLSPYNKEVLLYQLKINDGEIAKADAQVTLIQSLYDAKRLKVNAGKPQLSKDISDLLEANEFWWAEDNQLTIIIGNYRSEVVTNVVFSIQKGNCDNTSGDIVYLNLNFGEHPLEANSRIAYTSTLPFDYRKKFGDESNCGLIVSATGK